jgi:SAM-dependent methyltransferase
MSLARDTSSLARVLEPEVMDSALDAHDYDTMDHGEVNRCFVADFLAAAAATRLPADALVLDLGTGTAQIPIELCRTRLQARVMAIDLAEHMLALARRNVDAAVGRSGARVGLRRIDLYPRLSATLRRRGGGPIGAGLCRRLQRSPTPVVRRLSARGI